MFRLGGRAVNPLWGARVRGVREFETGHHKGVPYRHSYTALPRSTLRVSAKIELLIRFIT